MKVLTIDMNETHIERLVTGAKLRREFAECTDC